MREKDKAGTVVVDGAFFSWRQLRCRSSYVFVNGIHDGRCIKNKMQWKKNRMTEREKEREIEWRTRRAFKELAKRRLEREKKNLAVDRQLDSKRRIEKSSQLRLVVTRPTLHTNDDGMKKLVWFVLPTFIILIPSFPIWLPLFVRWIVLFCFVVFLLLHVSFPFIASTVDISLLVLDVSRLTD